MAIAVSLLIFSHKKTPAMKRIITLVISLLFVSICLAQKKPLDHSVYDSWQHIGERMISNDGKWVVYTIDPQEGDNELVIQSSTGTYKKVIARGYNAGITDDSRYVVFRIKPFFKETRDARIKKKRPDDMPKDSFAIVELGKENVWKKARVKNYKMPEKETGWVAFHLEKAVEKKEAEGPKRPDVAEKRITDSLNRVIDSLHNVIASMPVKKSKNKDGDDEIGLTPDSELRTPDYPQDADGDETPAAPVEAGTDLVVRNLTGGQEKIFNNVLEYYFSKKGQKLLIEQAKNPKDSASKPMVLLYDLKEAKTKVLSKGGNDFRNFVMTEDGSQVAWVAERDARPKDLQKFYRIWYYKQGIDSAALLADKNSVDMKLGMTISEFGNLNFSKSGRRLFFAVGEIQPAKDTSIIEIDMPKVDIWHYNDDYLQTVQNVPARLRASLQENFLAVYDLDKRTIKQLGTKEIPQVLQTNEGDGDTFVGVTDVGKRIESQWRGSTLKDIYAINVNDGTEKLVKKDLEGSVSTQTISPTGKYIMWYDSKAKNYFAWDGSSTRNITEKINVPIWDEEHDSPSNPSPYGVMKWTEDDAVFIYDKYGAWKVSMKADRAPIHFIGGRDKKLRYRYIQTDPEERYLKLGQRLVFQTFNQDSKKAGLWQGVYKDDHSFKKLLIPIHFDDAYSISQVVKARKC